MQWLGEVISCAGGGQDKSVLAGVPWPEPRFSLKGETVLDRLTDLVWTRNADLGDGPVSWDGALSIAGALNDARLGGWEDWRLPNVRELASLADMSAHSPALPPGHPFQKAADAYWSATTSLYDPSYAWTLYLIDGPVGVGHKPKPEFHAWAVRGGVG